MLVENCLEIIGASLGLTGFAFGLWQYYEAQKWKKAEFAAGLLLKLKADPALSACCKILDWSSREIQIPEHLRISDKEFAFEHNPALLTSGMKPETEKHSFNRSEELYRDLFDEFFTYLEEVNHFIDIGLIEQGQVSALKYWLEELAAPRFVSGSVFNAFIKHYGYKGVIRLMQKFGVSFSHNLGSGGG